MISIDPENKKKDSRWICRCSCGKTVSVVALILKNGNAKSCGCLRSELAKARATTHGQTKSKEYRTWDSMRQRCNNQAHIAYQNYGGRGISVCDRWDRSFENFLSDMGYRPSLDYTINRINNDGNYEPGNCEWALEATQKNNRRDNRFIEINGVTRTLTEWARENGKTFNIVHKRLAAGWDLHRALTQARRITSKG